MAATKLPSTGVLVAALAGAIVVVAALAVLMRRRPEAFPLLAILALPFRLPISAEGRTVNLLIPLYLVVAAGALAHLVPRMLARGSSAGGSDPAMRQGSPDVALTGAAVSLRGPSPWLTPRGLELVLITAVALYAVQTIYSADRAKAAANLAFF